MSIAYQIHTPSLVNENGYLVYMYSYKDNVWRCFFNAGRLVVDPFKSE